MLKKIYIPILMAIYFFIYGVHFACGAVVSKETKKEDVLPPGMERVKVGSSTMVIPEGKQSYKEGSQVWWENADQYMARRFKDMDDRIKKIEERLLKMEEDIKELRKSKK
jgi:hypothetical protein